MTDKDKEMVDKMVEYVKEFVFLSSCMKDEILQSVQAGLTKELREQRGDLYTTNDALFFASAAGLIDYYRNEIRRYKEKEGL